MAKDDMSLLMFKVLAYLYECMVDGVAVNSQNFKVENCYFGKDLKQSYLNDICKILEKKGYTEGFVCVKTWGGEVVIASYDAKITPEGFEYLKENNMMKKAYNYLKEAKGWIPFF
jgi:hypothetical protein